MPSHPVKPPEWIDAAQLVVEESTLINASPADVWPHIADHQSWPKWFETLKSVEPLGSPTGIGGGRRVNVPGMAIDEEFTAWDENEHFAFAVIKTKIPFLAALAESVRLEPVGDDQCRVVYRQGFDGRKGFGWLIQRVGKPASKGVATALEALKALVEAS